MAFGSSVLTHKKEQQIKIAGEFKPTVDCLCAIRRGFVAVYKHLIRHIAQPGICKGVIVLEAYKDRLPELWRRRAEHYYSEFARAEKGAELWRKGDLEGYGQLVFESGKSSISTSNFKHPIRNKIFTSAVALNDCFNQVFRYIGIICEQLFSVLGQAVPAVTEAGIVVMSTDTRIKADAVDNLLSIQPLHLCIGIQFIELDA